MLIVLIGNDVGNVWSTLSHSKVSGRSCTWIITKQDENELLPQKAHPTQIALTEPFIQIPLFLTVRGLPETGESAASASTGLMQSGGLRDPGSG